MRTSGTHSGCPLKIRGWPRFRRAKKSRVVNAERCRHPIGPRGRRATEVGLLEPGQSRYSILFSLYLSLCLSVKELEQIGYLNCRAQRAHAKLHYLPNRIQISLSAQPSLLYIGHHVSLLLPNKPVMFPCGASNAQFGRRCVKAVCATRRPERRPAERE